MMIQGTPKIDFEPKRQNEARHGIGDLPAHQHRRDAGPDLHHRQRHDEGGDADAGDAEGGDEAEPEAGRERQHDRDRARHRQIGDVDVIGLGGEERQHDRRRAGDRADAEIDLGGEDHEGQADRNDRGDRNLLENVLEIAERSEGRTGDAEKEDQAQKGDERRDIAQLIAQEIPEAKDAGGTRFSALRVHHDPIVKRPPTGDPC